MRLFLDSSVLLAASASPSGASRLLFRSAPSNEWVLVATPYVLEEVLNNLPTLPVTATSSWSRLRSRLMIHDDVLTLDKAAVFPVTKDRPVLFGALAWADVLLTLDRSDFGDLIGSEFLRASGVDTRHVPPARAGIGSPARGVSPRLPHGPCR